MSFKLTSDQENALNNIKEFLSEGIYKPKKNKSKINSNSYVLCGYAGTGKTSLVPKIVEEASRLGFQVQIGTPTNQAAKVLNSKLRGIAATTVHKIIYATFDPNSKTSCTVKEADPRTLLIVDESSMLNTELLEDIEHYVSSSIGNKILFIGDNFQLEPIGDDPFVFEYPNISYLREIVRVESGNKILDLGEHIRTANKAEIISYKEPNDNYNIFNDKEEGINSWLEDLVTSNPILIVSTNPDRVNYNKVARKQLYGKNAGIAQPGEVLISIANSDSIANGEVFELSENFDVTLHIENLIFNEDKDLSLAIIEDEDKGTILLLLNTKKPSFYHQSDFNWLIKSNPKLLKEDELMELLFEEEIYYKDHRGKPQKIVKKGLISSVSIATYGYAISAHKSQGGQWDKVYVLFNYCAKTWNPARWLYTAITRSSRYLGVILSPLINVKNE